MKSLFALMTISLLTGNAFAHGDAKVKKAEKAMMSACKKEYPKQVKGKKFSEVAEWVESEERGENKETFTKSRCFQLHEDWEKVSGRDHDEAAEHHE